MSHSFDQGSTSHFSKHPTDVNRNNSLSDVYVNEYIQLHSHFTESSTKQSFTCLLKNELDIYGSAFHICLDSIQLAHLLMLLKKLDEYSTTTEVSNAICSHLRNFLHCLPITILWKLHDIGLLKLSTYLKLNINQQQILKELVFALQTCSLSKCEEHQQQASYILCLLTNFGYGSIAQADKALAKMCQYLLQYVIKNVLEKLSVPCPSKEIIAKSVFHYMRSNAKCSDSDLQSCFLHQMIMYISKNPNLKVSDAIMQQCNWRSFSMPSPLFQAHKEMLNNCNFDEVSAALKKALARPEINWNSLLTFSSSVLVIFKNAASFFEDFIAEAVKIGLEDNCSSKLVIGLLLARQCCLEGGHLFMSYSAWFKKYFKNGGHNLISSTRGFRFLMKFLTSLVPFEPLQFIRVQVMNPPTPPNVNLRELLREYTSLALTRIDDLKRNSPEIKVESSAVAEEVADAVKMFGNSGKIPSNIMEMSIFRKSYYLDQFLPSLLQARPLPDVADDRMKLISSLLKLGKIPKSMFAAYEAKCAAESSKLLEEIIDLDDDFDEPHQQIDQLKQVIKQLFVNDHEIQSQARGDLGTSLRRILHQLVFEDSTIDDEAVVNLDIEQNVSSCDIHEQKINALLESISFNSTINFQKLNYFIEVLGDFTSLKNDICRRLWSDHTNEVRKSSFEISSGASLFLLGSLADRHWRVKFTFSRIFQVEEKDVIPNYDVKNGVPLLEAILLTSFNLVHVTSFFNTLQFHLQLIFQLDSIYNIERDESFEKALKLLYSFVYYAHERVEHYLQENTAFGDLKMLNHELSKKLEKSKSILLASHTSEEDTFIEVIKREMCMDLEDDFLSLKSKRLFYSKVLMHKGLELSTIEKLVEYLLDNSSLFFDDNFPNKRFCHFICENLALLLQTNQCDNPGCWLLSVFEKHLQAVLAGVDQRNELRQRLAHKEAIRSYSMMMMRLPSMFLFAHLQSRWSQFSADISNASKSLVPFANDYLRCYIYEFTFSTDLCQHLFKGLLQCVMSDDMKLASYLCTNLPLLFVYVIVEWDRALEVQSFCKIRSPQFFEIVSRLRGIVVDGQTKTMLDCNLCSNLPVYPVCLVFILLNRETHQQKYIESLQRLSALFSNMFLPFVLSLIAYIGQQMNSEGVGELDRYSLIIDQLLPHVSATSFCQALSQPALLSSMFPDAVSTNYFHFAMIRLLSRTKNVSTITNNEEFLTHLLISYRKCHQHFECGEPNVQDLILQSAQHANTSSLKRELQTQDMDSNVKTILMLELQRRST